MKLSIIVPVYNAQKYLRKCLETLVNQTIDDYEIILINDGSTDDSALILEEYAQKYQERIKVLTVENGGQGRARNIGLNIARGEYIGFADSDDWVEEEMFEKLYSKAIYTNAEIVLCDTIRFEADGRETYMHTSSFSRVYEISPVVWNKLFKRELLQTIRFPESMWYEDLPFVINSVLAAEKIVRLEEALYHYRIGQPSTCNNNNSLKNLDIIAAVEETRAIMAAKGEEEGFRYILINHVLLEAINRLAIQPDSEGKIQAINKTRQYVKTNVPYLNKCTSYKRETSNRKIVMFLNYYGLEKLSLLLVSVKKALTRG